MSDRISLLGVRARGYHGVLADEKRDGQDFVVDVVLHLDLRPAGTSDDLTATVNYAEVGAEVAGGVGLRGHDDGEAKAGDDVKHLAAIAPAIGAVMAGEAGQEPAIAIRFPGEARSGARRPAFVNPALRDDAPALRIQHQRMRRGDASLGLQQRATARCRRQRYAGRTEGRPQPQNRN